MKRSYRILALFLFLLMAASTGVFYQMYFISTMREALKLGTLTLALLASAFLIGWILQKANVKLEQKS
ncbi:MAG: hypothetical protein ACHQF2_04605 [Flavobacteriales bacterium]